ncbi:MAG: tryptophan synthase subunit alpha [Planctomycetes bacterium]|nr:tryptophan synthase subunit alpha [Planctomycetota bacterium]
MNPIDLLFARLKAEGKKAFIPFIPAGDPNLDATAKLLRESAKRGAALIEVGFPYSDPIADGSVIQASYTRALANGVGVDAIFAMLRTIGDIGAPLVAMASYTLVHHRGLEPFVLDAKSAGLSGAIVPDLPVDEAQDLARIAAKHDFKLILLVTPTTPRDRALQIVRLSTGFLYCVSVVGITGERRDLPPELLDQLRWLRTQTTLPLCVGFGISTPDHVHMLRESADGVIVGSALVRKLDAKKPVEEMVRDVGNLVQSLADALNNPRMK